MGAEMAAWGWRELLILGAALVAVYGGITLYRLARVRRGAHEGDDRARFGAQQFMRGVEEELAGLRAEVAALQEEVGGLRTDVDNMKAARLVAPQYGEAMSLAQQGLDALTIADRCGIAVAEAELVCALSRGAGRQEGK